MDTKARKKGIREMEELFRSMMAAHEQMKYSTLSLYQKCTEMGDAVGKKALEEFMENLQVQERWLNLANKSNKALTRPYNNVIPLPNLASLENVSHALEAYCPTYIQKQIDKHLTILEEFKNDLKHMPGYIPEPCRFHVVANIGPVMPKDCYRCTVLYETYELETPERLQDECE